MIKPHVSIIIPVYNASKAIARCLDSLLEQDYDNYQILAINDGSKDNSLDILKAYAKKNKNLIVLDKANSGAGATRNYGLDYLTKTAGENEFVAFVDADDWVEKDFVSTLANLLNHDNVAMSCCRFKWSKKVGKPLNESKFKTVTLTPEQAIGELYIDRLMWCAIWNKMFKLKEIGSLRTLERNFGENLIFEFDFLNSLPKESVVMATTKRLYHYMATPGSLSSKGFREEKLEFLNVLKRNENILQEQKMTKPLQFARSWRFLATIEQIYYAKTAKRKDVKNALKKEAKQLLPDYMAVRKKYAALFRRLAHLILWAP